MIRKNFSPQGLRDTVKKKEKNINSKYCKIREQAKGAIGSPFRKICRLLCLCPAHLFKYLFRKCGTIPPSFHLIRWVACVSVVIVPIFYSGNRAQAQQLTSGADFLGIDAGARSQGMGGAFTAVADDVNALTWNPAGLALLEHPEVGYLHMLYLSDIAYNFGGIALPLPAGENTFGVGIGFVNLGVPPFDSTNGLAPSVSAGDNDLSASFAFRIKDLISFGVTGKYIFRNIAGFNAQAMGGDFGVLLTPGSGFSVGAGVFNVGQQVKFVSEADSLPTLGRLGLACKVVETPRHTLLFALDNSYQFGAQAYSGAVGAEYWYDKTLALRAGFAGNSDQQNPTAGMGVNLKFLQFDYAFTPLSTLGSTHRFSMIFRFGAEGASGLPAPAGLQARPLDREIVLSWNPIQQKDLLGYQLYLKKPGTQAYVRLTTRPIRETTLKLKNLKNGQEYAFGVVSVSAAGRESAMSKLTVTAGAAAVAALTPPSGLKASPAGEGVQLEWSKPTTGNPAGYNLYLLGDPGKPPQKLTARAVTETKVVLKKLNTGKLYLFAVSIVGSDGSESGLSQSLEVRLAAPPKQPVPTPTPAPPAKLSIVTQFKVEPGDGSAKLTWNAVDGAAGYHLYVSDDGSGFRRLTKAPQTVLKALLKPLKNGKTYYFAVTAVDVNGIESDMVVQKVQPAPAQ